MHQAAALDGHREDFAFGPGVVLGSEVQGSTQLRTEGLIDSLHSPLFVRMEWHDQHRLRNWPLSTGPPSTLRSTWCGMTAGTISPLSRWSSQRGWRRRCATL